jgi:hypothetical protein
MNIAIAVHDKRLATFVPAGQECDSICAIIWVSGSPTAVSDTGTAKIGFHNVYDNDTQLPSGYGNAVLGSYLGKLGFNYQTIIWMTSKPATGANWLGTHAKELGIVVSGESSLPRPGVAPVWETDRKDREASGRLCWTTKQSKCEH